MTDSQPYNKATSYLAIGRRWNVNEHPNYEKIKELSEQEMQQVLQRYIAESKEWIACSITLAKEKHGIHAIEEIEYEIDNHMPEYIIVYGKAKILDD